VPVRLALGLTAIATIAGSSPRPSGATPGTLADAAFEWHEVRLGVLADQAQVQGNPFVEQHGWHYGLVVQAPVGTAYGSMERSSRSLKTLPLSRSRMPA
jgi:hypothetical protein